MSYAYPFALALAVALIDVTLGYPERLARRIGTPSRWIATWFGVVRLAAGVFSGRAALAVYLAPILVVTALIAQILPDNPIGFAATALLASTLSGRQSLDIRARALAASFEQEDIAESWAGAEALGADESEPRLARASAAAIAARFADEIVAPTLFILVGGLVGAGLCRALSLAARAHREAREGSPLWSSIAVVEVWVLSPVARIGAVILAAAAFGRFGAFRAAAAPAPHPTAPAEAVMLRVLGLSPREEPDYVRRALGLFRRAAALEMIVLALLAAAALAV